MTKSQRFIRASIITVLALLSLSAMAGVAEEGAGFRTPTLGRLAVAHPYEISVRTGGFLIDAADAGRERARGGRCWH